LDIDVMIVPSPHEGDTAVSPSKMADQVLRVDSNRLFCYEEFEYPTGMSEVGLNYVNKKGKFVDMHIVGPTKVA
jgi:hypothetical protein